MFHVFSTLANSNRYMKYRQAPQNDINIAERTVLIKGGSGVHHKSIGTPLGVYNSVEDEDMEWLKEDPTFKKHVANGYITVEKRKVNPEVAAANMVTHNQRTDACPIVPEDFRDDGKRETIKPVRNKKAG